MRPLARGPAAVVAALSLGLSWPVCPMAATGRAGTRALADVLQQAGTWIERFANDSVAIVGSEEYVQEYRPAPSSGAPVRRRLVSDIALMKTSAEEAAAGYPWVVFRDVLEVDGEPLGDHRGRLEKLFADVSNSSREEAARLTAESARYNIGPGTRTVNTPLFALFFLVPGNQHRFRFEAKEGELVEGVAAAVVAYRERERPTMIRSPGRGDRLAKGRFWIDASGRVVKSRLEVDAERHWAMETDVVFGWDAHVEAWVPVSMSERHHWGNDESLDCEAKYSNYRRFSTSARIIGR